MHNITIAKLSAIKLHTQKEKIFGITYIYTKQT